MTEDGTEAGIFEGSAAVSGGSEDGGTIDPMAEAARLREEKAALEAGLAEAREKLGEAVRRAEALEKEAAARRYLEKRGVTGGYADIALRGMKEEIARLTVGGDGEIEDTSALDGLLGGVYAPLKNASAAAPGPEPAAGNRAVSGVAVPHPPIGPGAEFGLRTREEILAIRDGTERRRAIAGQPEMFGLS